METKVYLGWVDKLLPYKNDRKTLLEQSMSFPVDDLIKAEQA